MERSIKHCTTWLNIHICGALVLVLVLRMRVVADKVKYSGCRKWVRHGGAWTFTTTDMFDKTASNEKQPKSISFPKKDIDKL